MIYQQTITLQRQKKAQVGLDLLNTRTALMLLMYLSVNFSNLWESTGLNTILPKDIPSNVLMMVNVL